MVSGRNRGAGISSTASSRWARQHMIRQLNRISDFEIAAPAPALLLLLPLKPAVAFSDATRKDTDRTSVAIADAEPAAFEGAGGSITGVVAESRTEAEREGRVGENSSRSSSAAQEGLMLACNKDVQPARQLCLPEADVAVRSSSRSKSSNSSPVRGLTLASQSGARAARQLSSSGADAGANIRTPPPTDHPATTPNVGLPTHSSASCFCPGHEILCGKDGGAEERKSKRRSARRRSTMDISSTAAVPASSEHTSDASNGRFKPLRRASSADAEKESDRLDISDCLANITNIPVSNTGVEKPQSTKNTPLGKQPLNLRRSSRRSSMSAGGVASATTVFTPFKTGDLHGVAALRRSDAPPPTTAAVVRNRSPNGETFAGDGRENLPSFEEKYPIRRSRRASSVGVARETTQVGLTIAAIAGSVCAEAFLTRPNVVATGEATSEATGKATTESNNGLSESVCNNANFCSNRQGVTTVLSLEEQPRRCLTQQIRVSPVSARRLSLRAAELRGTVDPAMLGVDLNLDAVAATGNLDAVVAANGNGASGGDGDGSSPAEQEERSVCRELHARRSSTCSIGEGMASFDGRASSANSSLSAGRTSLPGRVSSPDRPLSPGGALSPVRVSSQSGFLPGGIPDGAGELSRPPALASPGTEGTAHTDRHYTRQRDTPALTRRSRRGSMRCSPAPASRASSEARGSPVGRASSVDRAPSAGRTSSTDEVSSPGGLPPGRALDGADKLSRPPVLTSPGAEGTAHTDRSCIPPRDTPALTRRSRRGSMRCSPASANRASSEARASPVGRASSVDRAPSAGRTSSSDEVSSPGGVPPGRALDGADELSRPPVLASPGAEGAAHTDRSCTPQRDTPALMRRSRRRSMRCSPAPASRSSSEARASPVGRASSVDRTPSAGTKSSAAGVSSPGGVPSGRAPVDEVELSRPPALASRGAEGVTQTDRSCTPQRDAPVQKRRLRRRSMRCLPASVGGDSLAARASSAHGVSSIGDISSGGAPIDADEPPQPSALTSSDAEGVKQADRSIAVQWDIPTPTINKKARRRSLRCPPMSAVGASPAGRASSVDRVSSAEGVSASGGAFSEEPLVGRGMTFGPPALASPGIEGATQTDRSRTDQRDTPTPAQKRKARRRSMRCPPASEGGASFVVRASPAGRTSSAGRASLANEVPSPGGVPSGASLVDAGEPFRPPTIGSSVVEGASQADRSCIYQQDASAPKRKARRRSMRCPPASEGGASPIVRASPADRTSSAGRASSANEVSSPGGVPSGAFPVDAGEPFRPPTIASSVVEGASQADRNCIYQQNASVSKRKARRRSMRCPPASQGGASPIVRASPADRASSAGRASSSGRDASADEVSSPGGVPSGSSLVHAGEPFRPPTLASSVVEGATQADRSCISQQDASAPKRKARRRSMRCLSTRVAMVDETSDMVMELARSSASASVDESKASCVEERERTGLIAAVINDSMHKLEATPTPTKADGVWRLLRSVLAELVAAETCAVRHEKKAAGTDKRRKGSIAKRKRVHFCSFDFSTVDMPWDTVNGSDLSATEVAKCLQSVTEAQQRFQEALQGFNDGESGIEPNGITPWKAFLCELRTLSASTGAGSAALGIRKGCLAAGNDDGGGGARQEKWGVHESEAVETTKDLSKAARFLLAELVPLEGCQVPAKSLVRERLGGMLSSLLRFRLRTLFNPPPEPLSAMDAAVSDRRRFPGRRAGIPPPTHFSKVHEVVKLTPQTAKRGPSEAHPYDHTEDAAPNAAFSRALRWLHGYSDRRGMGAIDAAEEFLTGTGDGKLAEEEAVELAGQHVIAVADVMGAFRARTFLRSLLESDVVEAAVAQAGGWHDVEKLASALAGLKGSADIDLSLTLLSDVDKLKTWLQTESRWRHGQRVENVVQKLLVLLVPLSENHKRRWMTAEAYQRLRENVSDVRSRFSFPTVTEVSKTGATDGPAKPSDAAEEFHGERHNHNRMRVLTPEKAERKLLLAGSKSLAVLSLTDGKRVTDQASAVAEESRQKRSKRSKRRASIM